MSILEGGKGENKINEKEKKEICIEDLLLEHTESTK